MTARMIRRSGIITGWPTGSEKPFALLRAPNTAMISSRSLSRWTRRARGANAAVALLVLAGVLFSGCSLLAPVSREEFVLVRLNGDTLPANLTQGRGVDGRFAEQRILWSRLSLFESGRFAWDVKQVNLIDGAPDPDLLQGDTRTLGPYEKRDTILALSWMFHARVVGDTVFMWDVSGVAARAMFEFIRVR